MTLEPYIIITGNSPDVLQLRCNVALKIEEEEEDYLFYYMPLGAPLVTPNVLGENLWSQAFIVASHQIGEDESLEAYQLTGSGLN